MFLPNSIATDLSGLLSLGKKVISGRNIGNITLDVTLFEDHTSTLRISENPIESGAVIADHAVMEGAQATITGVMVDYEPQSSIDFVLGGFSLRDGIDFLNNLPLPAELKNFTDETVRMVEKGLGSFTALSDTLNLARPIAPWLPDFLGTILGDQSGSDTRVAQAFIDLKTVQKSGEPITVVTGICTYTSMMITSISVRQDQDGAAEFSIGIKEVFIVDTAMVGGVSVPNQTSTAGTGKSGRSDKQSAPKSQKGKTNPKPTNKKSSVLNDAFGKKK